MAKKTAEKKITGTVFGGQLNVRAEADVKSKVVRTIPDGTVIDIVEDGAEWCKISDGYVMKCWIKINK